jgi:hypothetical protein
LSRLDYARNAGKVKAATQPQSLDNSAKPGHKIRMVIESIREFNRAVPFKPYEIQMASGECYEVPHPDFISISHRGSFVVLIDANDRPHHLSSLLMERVSPQRTRRRRKTGKH